jgi:hypothetical protein
MRIRTAYFYLFVILSLNSDERAKESTGELQNNYIVASI